jgi:repressor of nif and glnA expression
MTKTPHLTAKQLELMRVITAANDDGTPCDMDQILERIRYHTTKDSLQFSLRVLIDRGLVKKLGIEKRRGAARRLITVTDEGRGYGQASARARPQEVDNIIELGADILSADLEPVLESIIPDIL